MPGMAELMSQHGYQALSAVKPELWKISTSIRWFPSVWELCLICRCTCYHKRVISVEPIGVVCGLTEARACHSYVHLWMLFQIKTRAGTPYGVPDLGV